MNHLFLSTVLFAPLFLVGCGGDAPSAPPPAKVAPEFQKLVLAAKPAGALSVGEAKKLGTADSCAISGRISNRVPGFAVFTLMDSSLPYCGEKNKEDNCKTPWDYCCETSETRAASSLVVEIRDAAGKPLTGALPDLRLLDEVTMQGRLVKDEHGNHVLLASGWHPDARPQLADDLSWPR